MTGSRFAFAFALSLVVPLLACAPGVDVPDAGDTPDAGDVLDAGTVDAGWVVRDYAHVPATGDVPASLDGDSWRTHWTRDIAPFWTMEAALGTPAGNYPTFRTMTGTTTNRTDRYPRMIGRQVYAYAMGYALTGDEALLERAHAGVEWLRLHAKDPRGGYHALLDADGNAKGNDPKWAQDLSYVMLGYAAWWFVTRDPVAEAELLAARDLLFDPDTYWDAEHQRIRDGVKPDLSAEADQSNDGGGWVLVAQLDPMNAFLMLTQPVLSEESRRTQFLADLRTLANTMLTNFRSEKSGVFWGTTTRKGYGERHVDWGHTIKTYWMLLQLDKRLADHPFQGIVLQAAPGLLARAFDPTNGRWGKRPTSGTAQEYGSDWWITAELDQFAATLNLWDRSQTETLGTTAGHYVGDWVDDRVGELIPGIRADGSAVFNWPDGDTAKCNEWKSGFHSTEHALVLYLTGRDAQALPADLWFAVPPENAAGFIATPYVFQGHESARTPGDTIEAGGRTLREVKVTFDELY